MSMAPSGPRTPVRGRFAATCRSMSSFVDFSAKQSAKALLPFWCLGAFCETFICSFDWFFIISNSFLSLFEALSSYSLRKESLESLMCVLFYLLKFLRIRRCFADGSCFQVLSASLRLLLSSFRPLLYQGLPFFLGILFTFNGATESAMLDITLL